jgi:calcineurin-like phosphoesterase family protein
MNIWLVSDTHFNHTNIIKYCNRPFKDTNEMNDKLIKNWNSVVAKDDIVYHLGDFAMGSGDKVSGLTASLNGRKSIILGNHDTHSAMWFMEHGFDWACRFPIVFNKFMILSHEPIFMEANSPYINVHGHVHQHKYADEEHYYNVSVEHHNYTPVNLDEILEHLKQFSFEESHRDKRIGEPWLEEK